MIAKPKIEIQICISLLLQFVVYMTKQGLKGCGGRIGFNFIEYSGKYWTGSSDGML